MLLSDNTLRELISSPTPLITDPSGVPLPISVLRENEYGVKAISSGPSPFGFDVTLAPTIKRFISSAARSKVSIEQMVEVHEPCLLNGVLNPKDPDSSLMWTDDRIIHDPALGDYFILNPGEFVLGVTNEVVNLPDDITVMCVTKSTYARIGTQVMVTPINAGFNGPVVIEICNHSPFQSMIFVNEGIAQFMFHKGDEACNNSYSGPYQGQEGIQLAKV